MSTIKYILIPEYEVSVEMLEHECVSPFVKPLPVNAWENLRKFDDNGVTKAVVKFKTDKGTPKPIADYINANIPTVYTDHEEVLAVIEGT